MSSVSGDVPIECPNCHNEIFKPFAWVAENDRFDCPACHKTTCFDPREFVRRDREDRRASIEMNRWLSSMRWSRRR